MSNFRLAIRSAVSSIAFAAVVTSAFASPALAYHPMPSHHLSNAPLGTNSAWNPKVEAAGGLATEDLGLMVTPTRRLVVTTDQLVGVSMTTVSVEFNGVTHHANLVAGQSVTLDFGTFLPATYTGGAEVFITYASTTHATGIVVHVDAGV